MGGERRAGGVGWGGGGLARVEVSQRASSQSASTQARPKSCCLLVISLTLLISPLSIV